MRILMVTDYYPPIMGGIANVVQSLAEILDTRGHKVYVYTIAGRAHTHRTKENGIIIEKAKHFGSFFPFLFKQIKEPNMPPMPDPLFIKGLKKIVARFKPDVIHAHGWAMFATSFYKKIGPDIGAVATLHDYGFTCPKRDLIPDLQDKRSIPMICQQTNFFKECILCSSKTYGILKSLGIVTCTRLFSPLLNELNPITAVSNCIAKIARNKLRTKISVVPNFIDSTKFQLEIADEKKIEKPYILFVGRLTTSKGISLLIRAFKILQKSLPDAKLVIVGKKDPYYKTQIVGKSIIQFEGVDNGKLMSLYRNAEIVVVPSIWADPAPLVTLEAMAFGKPLVVTNVGGLKEIIIHGKTGLIVEPKPENLAGALEFLLSNKSASLEMGIKGKNHLLENYSSQIIVPKYEKVYDEAIQLGRR